MRPTGGRENKITWFAVQYANLKADEIESRLAHLRTAPNQKAAELQKIALRRVARVRKFEIPRIPQCRNTGCPCHTSA